MKGFSHLRDGEKKPAILRPKYFTSFFFTVLKKATSTFSSSLLRLILAEALTIWAKF